MSPDPNENQGKVSAPPIPEVAVRTLNSDMKSIAQGEATPTPEIVTPAGFDEDEPVFVPEGTNPYEDAKPVMIKKSHTLLWVMILCGILIVGALVGYFYLYPKLIQQQEEALNPTPTNSTPVVQVPVIQPHASLFVLEPQAKHEASIDVLSLSNIRSAFLAGSRLIATGTAEVVFRTPEKSQIASKDFLSAVVPSFLDASQIETWVEHDFTALTYVDSFGEWPAVIFKFKSDANQDSLTQWLANLEKADLSSFFITDPEGFSPFQNGQIKSFLTRQAPAKIEGATFVYGRNSTLLIISASLEGAKEAARLLAL